MNYIIYQMHFTACAALLFCMSLNAQSIYDEKTDPHNLPSGIFYQSGPGETNTFHRQYPFELKLTINANVYRNFEIAITKYPMGQLIFRQWDVTHDRWIPWRRLLMTDTLGNVGIGTAYPQSILTVKGTITAKKVKATQADWPDYVFDSTYILPPLTNWKILYKPKNIYRVFPLPKIWLKKEMIWQKQILFC